MCNIVRGSYTKRLIDNNTQIIKTTQIIKCSESEYVENHKSIKVKFLIYWKSVKQYKNTYDLVYISDGNNSIRSAERVKSYELYYRSFI